ncbi:hypothetical protein [Methylobacterium sp. NEAU K]|uniref:hypothetical protein n=1 Tax=Methylobacterium sp. NEAU K TaxID=3064946 RepID=UPI002734A75B|nr:hypothetical protein [Methylobacterium sp. NEAU K]MDP4005697.1 hypothetical protein [Methylobacterium sp. NEAU K]
MTSPWGPRPEALRSRAILERISDRLGLPVAAFFPDEAEPDEALAQAADLVTAFMAIGSVAARRTCLAFVRAASTRSSDTPGTP